MIKKKSQYDKETDARRLRVKLVGGEEDEH